MALTDTSYAAGVAAAVKNEQFATEVEVLERKQVLIGSYDPSITTIADNVPVQVYSAAEVANTYGAGFMLHRMAIAAFEGNQGAQTWVIPQPEDGAAVQATGTLTIGGAPTAAGTLSVYIGNDYLGDIAVATTDTPTTIGDAVAAAVTADADLPVTAVNAVGVVTFTAKSGGTFGNDIAITLNWGVGEELPAGVTGVVVAMATGATDPDIDDALNAMGTGDLANSEFWTDLNHGYGPVTATLNKVLAYVGAGNDYVGLYARTVARPLRSLNGNTTAGSGGLTAIRAITNARKTDRASGVICAPGSPVHPVELACLAMGIMVRVNNQRAEQTYIDQVLPGVIPGALSDQWTTSYDSRDTAVKDGVSTTMQKSGSLTIQNVLTMYHPDSVAIASNGYRSMRNISILQNVLNSIVTTFENEKWEGVTIVADAAKVSNATSRTKARDVSSVVDELLALTAAFEARAWIYTGTFTRDQISAGGLVTIRSGAQGFDSNLPILLSGEAGIYNTTVKFDTSLTVVL